MSIFQYLTQVDPLKNTIIQCSDRGQGLKLQSPTLVEYLELLLMDQVRGHLNVDHILTIQQYMPLVQVTVLSITHCLGHGKSYISSLLTKLTN